MFIHLRNHSEYSIVDGLSSVKDIAMFAKEDFLSVNEQNRNNNSNTSMIDTLECPSIAITEKNNTFSVIKFYQQCLANGVKPIIGLDLSVLYRNPSHNSTHLGNVTLLAMNEEGYKNILNLSSLVYTSPAILSEKSSTDRAVEWSVLCENSQGLIMIIGSDSPIQGFINDKGKIHNFLKDTKSIFEDRLYLGISWLGLAGEHSFLLKMESEGLNLGIPLVLTNNTCFVKEDDFEVHEARVCIYRGEKLYSQDRLKDYSKEQYLKSSQQIAELVGQRNYLIQNSIEIAKRCNVSLSLGKPFLPIFQTPDKEPLDIYFDEQVEKGLLARLKQKLGKDISEEDEKTYRDRVEFEKGVIKSMGFVSYFLIVMEFISWSKSNGVPVGPGRGSGAGSLIAFCLGITDVNPIDFSLLFERFLNPDRVSLPDFDIDFCIEGRDRVINHVSTLYGSEKVSQIITFGTMAARGVVRDVVRTLDHSHSLGSKIVDLIPNELNITLKKAIEQEKELSKLIERDEDVKDIMTLALKLEGTVRNVGTHAGGVVIAPSQIVDFSGIYVGDDGMPVSQLDKDDIEVVGLVKFDFLGLKTLTVVDKARTYIKQRGGLVNIDDLPFDDKATYSLISKGATNSIFQLESRGMTELVKKLIPENMEDIAALLALFRPGPLGSGMVDDFIECKHGNKEIEYSHPLLESALSTTYGVILYQEQVMQIVQNLAGYTLSQADMMRRIMGKKKFAEMEKERSKFCDGAQAKGVDKQIANYVFDLIDKFAGYGFNKSHSVAYAIVSYQTAYLKAHYPIEFMTSNLNCDLENQEKVCSLLKECKRLGIDFLVPDINESYYEFRIKGDSNKLAYGLGSIKGLGKSICDSIANEREKHGLYSSIIDFCKRLSTNLNKRALESLIASGSLDKLAKTKDTSRSQLLLAMDDLLQEGTRQNNNISKGQDDLFGNEDVDYELELSKKYPPTHPLALSSEIILELENQILGFYLSAHPSSTVVDRTLMKIVSISQIKKNRITGKKVRLAGFISKVRSFKTKNGGTINVLTLIDGSGDNNDGQIDILVDDETAKYLNDMLKKREQNTSASLSLCISGFTKINYRDELTLEKIQILTISDAKSKWMQYIEIILSANLSVSKLETIVTILQNMKITSGGINWKFILNTVKLEGAFNGKWQIKLDKEQLDQISEIIGSENIRMIY